MGVIWTLCGFEKNKIRRGRIGELEKGIILLHSSGKFVLKDDS
jgi:hypothetical protein